MFVPFLFIVALQIALIYWQHFSPFERESNLRAVLWGAKPAPRYWAVLALDVCTVLLVVLLVLSTWSQTPNDLPAARLLRTLPAWIVVSLLAAVVHHYVTKAVICFPNYPLMVRRLIVAAVMGILVVMATLLMVAIAITPDVSAAFADWARALPVVIVPALLLALLVFALRAAAFLLRVIPVIGSFAQAAVSTVLLLWAMERYGRMVGEAMAVSMAWPGMNGLEGITLIVGMVALVALILVWRLPGPSRQSDAADPPLLVASQPTNVKATCAVTGTGATLAGRSVHAEVTRAPFGIVVKNAQGETLWQLTENGLTHDVLQQKILSIPVLYTGNTMKMKWRAWGQPVTKVTDIKADGDALVVTLDKAVVRLALHADEIVRVTVEAMRASLLHNAISLAFSDFTDAHYLGLGQRFNKVDQRGEEAYFFVEEGGVGYEWARKRLPWLYPFLRWLYGPRGSFPNREQCTGFPVPFCLIARERGASAGLFWNTSRRGSRWQTAREAHRPQLALCRRRSAVSRLRPIA